LTGLLPRAEYRRLPKPSLQNKLARLLWGAAYIALFRLSPVPAHAWRRVLLRGFGARIGPSVVVYPSARIWAPWALQVEEGATIGRDCELYNVMPVRLGRRAIVSQHAYVCTASHDYQSDFQLLGAPVCIEVEAWVGAGSFIGPGVTIGRGAVVGARAVVMRSLSPWTVVAGNPAQIVGRRSSSARNSLHGRPMATDERPAC